MAVFVSGWPIFRCPDTAEPVFVPEWPILCRLDTAAHVSVPERRPLQGQLELEAQRWGGRGGGLPGAGGAEADFAAKAGRAGRLSLEAGAE